MWPPAWENDAAQAVQEAWRSGMSRMCPNLVFPPVRPYALTFCAPFHSPVTPKAATCATSAEGTMLRSGDLGVSNTIQHQCYDWIACHCGPAYHRCDDGKNM